MNPIETCLDEVTEIERLNQLLPISLRSQISITRSSETNSTLISTQRTSRDQFTIQVDFMLWRSLSISQQNLLFWHEIARIEGNVIPYTLREPMILIIGCVFALTELISQNLLALVITFAVMGLASYQLYQCHRGEHNLRAASNADQRAIAIAIQAGYSASQAYNALHSSLEFLAVHVARTARHKSQWKSYQVRLRVLEISTSNPQLQTKLGSFASDLSSSSFPDFA